jgi:hypothetical protein
MKEVDMATSEKKTATKPAVKKAAATQSSAATPSTATPRRKSKSDPGGPWPFPTGARPK